MATHFGRTNATTCSTSQTFNSSSLSLLMFAPSTPRYCLLAHDTTTSQKASMYGGLAALYLEDKYYTEFPWSITRQESLPIPSHRASSFLTNTSSELPTPPSTPLHGERLDIMTRSDPEVDAGSGTQRSARVDSPFAEVTGPLGSTAFSAAISLGKRRLEVQSQLEEGPGPPPPQQPGISPLDHVIKKSQVRPANLRPLSNTHPT